MSRTAHPHPDFTLSGLEIAALVGELDSRLRGSYVSNIYSLEKSQLLKLKNGETEWTVILSPRRGAWISEKITGHGLTGQFTTSLRQELVRAKLESVSQLNLDRIIDFAFVIGGEKVELVLEMVPPGNILLLDQAKQIVIALEEVRGPHRRLVRGEAYRPPPQTRLLPSEVTEENLSLLLGKVSRVGRELGRGIALPRKYIDEILARSGMRQDDPSPPSPEKVRELKNATESLLSEAEEHKAYLVRVEGGEEIFVVRPVGGEVVRSATDIDTLVDELFDPSSLSEGVDQTETDRKILELEASLAALRAEVSENEARAALAKGLASRIQMMLLDEALPLVEEAGKTLPEELRSSLSDERSTAAIASLLFDYAKQQNADSERIRSVEKTMEAKKQREVKKIPKQAPSVTQRKTKKEWFEKFRWFTTSEGKLAIGGRDAQSNTTLIRRHLEEEDVVYHADLFGSPFFILKKGRSQTEGEVKEVAKATVSFSSAWKTGLGSADAYWVNPDQVSTSAPTGEFLARGSFMIKGKKSMVNKNMVEVSVGIDSDNRIVSGPEEAIAKNTWAHLTLVPHREKASDTAKKVLVELKKLGAGAEVQLTVDDVLRALPAGGGKIVRRKGAPKAY